MKVINKLRWIIVICIALALILAVSAQKISYYYEKVTLKPDIELQQSLQKTMACKSFKYRLQSGFTVNDRGEVISKIEGDKEHENTHIKGEMVNTAVDIYYIDGTIYNYDSLADKWLVIESGTSNSEELLISELNPLSHLKFTNINKVEKLKFEKAGGTECLVVKCQPSVENQLLESLWKNFEYLLWIDYKKDRINKAVLTATNKRNANTKLEIKLELYDFDKSIKIKAPDRTEKKKPAKNKK